MGLSLLILRTPPTSFAYKIQTKCAWQATGPSNFFSPCYCSSSFLFVVLFPYPEHYKINCRRFQLHFQEGRGIMGTKWKFWRCMVESFTTLSTAWIPLLTVEREREREERERCSCYFPLLGTETGTEYEITLLALGSRDHIPPQAFVFLSLLYLCLFLSTWKD